MCYNANAIYAGVSLTQRSSVARGAAIMVVSVILAKVLGVLYVVPLTRLIGPIGLGIYQNGYSLYTILLTLGAAGFPTAMGKLISERLARRQYAEVDQIFRVTLKTIGLLAVIFALVTWFGAPIYSYLVAVKDAAGSEAALVWSIRALAPAVLIVPFLSALRGYMQGFQRMDWSGYSQTIEQIFRVVAMIVGAAIAIHWFRAGTTSSIAAGAAAATFGAVVGAVAGLIFLSFVTVRLRITLAAQRSRQRSKHTDKEIRRMLLAVALPICAGALVVPISNLADSLTVQNFLMIFAHESLTQAERSFGILSRQAFTLIQLPLAFSLAIGSSILPAIASASAVGNQREVERTVMNTFRSMFFITLPLASAFFILAKPIDILLFNSTSGAPIIESISFMGIFSGLEQISTFMLQGIGKLYRPVRNLFLGVFVKVIFNLILIPHLHIMGAALATSIGYLFSSTLNVLAVKKYGRVQFSVFGLAIPMLGPTLLALGLMWLLKTGMERSLGLTMQAHHILEAGIITFVVLFAASAFYLVTSIRFRVVSSQELSRLPAVGGRLARLANKIRPVNPGQSTHIE